MTQAKKTRSRRLDGRSLRYLGLIAGLLGLVYLNSYSTRGPSVEANEAVNSTATKEANARRERPTATQPAGKPAEAWLEALWLADEAEVAGLIDAGVDVTAALDRRQTQPLHLLFFGSGCEFGASKEGVIPVLEHLLANGADSNAADDRGNTPLMLAAAECDPAPVRRLLAAGADMWATNLLGLTPFELTLSNASPAGLVLTDAGFRLSEDAFQRYREIYHDEPEVLAHLDAARPEAP
ncbi:MAG: hypothetical protein AAF552_04695 [Pseudomonadota bacterium]